MKTKCNTEEVLAGYVEDRLSDKERAKVEHHLAFCDTCLQEVVVARKIIRDSEFFEADTVPDDVTKRAIEAIRVIRGNSMLDGISIYLNLLLSKCIDTLILLWPWQTPGLAPVRGSKTVIAKDLILLKKSFSDLDVEIEIEKRDQDKTSIRVMLLRDNAPKKPLRVTLFKMGREVASFPLNGSAKLFEEIPFGHYVLIFTRKGIKAGEYSFEIKETRYGKQKD